MPENSLDLAAECGLLLAYEEVLERQENTVTKSSSKPSGELEFRGNAPQSHDRCPVPTSRIELQQGIFKMLDHISRGSLDSDQMRRFMEFQGFDGTDDEWREEFESMCEEQGGSVKINMSFDEAAFIALVDDDSDAGCYCSDSELQKAYDELVVTALIQSEVGAEQGKGEAQLAETDDELEDYTLDDAEAEARAREIYEQEKSPDEGSDSASEWSESESSEARFLIRRPKKSTEDIIAEGLAGSGDPRDVIFFGQAFELSVPDAPADKENMPNSDLAQELDQGEVANPKIRHWLNKQQRPKDMTPQRQDQRREFVDLPGLNLELESLGKQGSPNGKRRIQRVDQSGERVSALRSAAKLNLPLPEHRSRSRSRSRPRELSSAVPTFQPCKHEEHSPSTPTL